MQKIKELFETTEKVKSLEQTFSNLTEHATLLAKEIHEVKDELAKMREVTQNDAKVLTEVRLQFMDVVTEFASELERFKTFKRQVQTELLNRGQEELQTHLKSLTLELKTTNDEYKNIKAGLESLGKTLPAMQHELARLQTVAQAIKKEDFELAKTIGRVQSAENDRTQLLRKIDQLERVIAHSRRRQDRNPAQKPTPQVPQGQ